MRSALVYSIVCFAAGMAVSAQCPATLQTGFRTETGNGRPIAVWYPTTASEAAHDYGRIRSTVALNAPPANCARFPVIVFSHGFGGCNTQSVPITETLARRGYIVVAPNHRDANCGAEGGTGVAMPFNQPDTWTDATYADRRDDVKATLDWLLAGSPFAASADANRVGGAGHSLGGYTMIGLAGGWPSWKDSRLKAVVLYSPYLEPYLIDNRLARMNLPAQYQGGTLDVGITPFLDGTKGNAYGITGAPKLYLSLTRATHFEWTNSNCSRIATSVANCFLIDGNARMMVDYSSNFFDRFLNGQDRNALWSRASGLADYRRLSLTSPVSAASYLDANLAADSIVAAFGDALAPSTASATSVPLPVSLGGVSVSLEDSSRRVHSARLFFVSPGQVNFLLPEDVASGPVTVTVRSGAEIVSSGTLSAMSIAPALFSAAGNGKGVPAAQSLLVKPDGSRTTDLVFNPTSLAPVALDPQAGELYIILYGTGFRRGLSATARLGALTVPVLGISATPGFFGLDQLAIGPVPAAVSSGTSDLAITVEGRAANIVTLTFR